MKLQVTQHLAIELTEPNELIELMEEGDKVDFMQSLSCHDSVIKHVADQITTGMTDGGYSGSETITQSKPSTPLQSARREVAKLSGDVAKKEIERLERELERMTEQRDEFQDKYFNLYRETWGIQ